MTFKVNIEHGISLYTTDELISYGFLAVFMLETQI